MKKRYSAPKETPEQAAIRIEQENQARHDRAMRELARKDAERRAREEYLQGLKDFATDLRNGEGYSKAEADVRQDIGSDWLAVQRILEEKAELLTVYPSSALEWDTMAEAGIQRELLDMMLHDLKQGQSAEDVVLHIERRLTDEIISNRHRPSSSGTFHNATAVVRTEVFSRFLRQTIPSWKHTFEFHRRNEIKNKYQVS
jgi:hypothetical protein